MTEYCKYSFSFKWLLGTKYAAIWGKKYKILTFCLEHSLVIKMENFTYWIACALWVFAMTKTTYFAWGDNKLCIYCIQMRETGFLQENNEQAIADMKLNWFFPNKVFHRIFLNSGNLEARVFMSWFWYFCNFCKSRF